MTPINQRESDRVYEFIQQNTLQNVLSKLFVSLSDFLLREFGWQTSAGKKRSKLIIDNLERYGKITCQIDKRGSIKSVTFIPQTTAKVEPKADERELAQPPNIKADKPKPTHPKRIRQIIKRGVARTRREAEEKGERNERRFHVLVDELLELLTRDFSSIVLGATNFRSGRHNPRKNKIDIQDHNGEDVTPKLTVRQSDGRIFEGRLIYNSKSSYPAVREFNHRIIYHPGQEGALLKKAIRVTPKRSDLEIISEVVDDMIWVKLLPAEIKESVLSHFSEFENQISA